MGIKYIDYNQKYLDQTVKAWNENLIFDPISQNQFLSRIVYDPNFNPTFSRIALDERTDTVIGYCHGVMRKESYYTKGLEPHRGWINFVFVNEAYRRKGVAKKLYQSILKRMSDAGVKEITLCAYSPNYLHPGIDIRYESGIAFFEAMGFKLSESLSVSMQRSLWDFHWNETHQQKLDALAKQNIIIRNYEMQDFTNLMTFLNEEFEGGWVRNALNALNQGVAEQTIIICLDANDDIVGFCMRAIDGNPNRFGPIGVKASKRSLGLGGVIFDAMMLSMKKEGLLYTNFLWTSGDAIRFYERHGMSIYREFKTSRKDITHEKI